jgi:hypothetical protein
VRPAASPNTLKGQFFISFYTTSDENCIPIILLASYIVFKGSLDICTLAVSPTTLPSEVKATIEGVIGWPYLFGIIVTLLFS